MAVTSLAPVDFTNSSLNNAFKSYTCAKSQSHGQPPEALTRWLQMPELLAITFQFLAHDRALYPCLFVSRTWHAVASRVLWRELSFDTEERLEKFFLQHYSSLQAPTLEDMDESYFPDCNKDEAEGSPWSVIQELRLHKLKSVRPGVLESLVPRLQNLISLDAYICDGFQSKMIIQFALACPRLTQVSLPGCNRITDAALLALAQHCPKLEHLDLRACDYVSDCGITFIAARCKGLKHLNVGRVARGELISDRAVEALAIGTCLNTLGVAGCSVTDNGLFALAKFRAQSIERISVNSCLRITNAGVQALALNCPRLSVLEIKECHLVTDMAILRELKSRRVMVEVCRVGRERYEKFTWEEKQKSILERK
ncbi:uncharacterized protein VTP21DRAFT_6440 [Calcarisporiella thermophila]|uniref:uncharacterized protein n=1 Tax=Calcarisporiella thermophila TaxID=911321 RepID=UPI003743A6FA